MTAPGPGRGGVGFITRSFRGETVVIPRDMAPHVASGRLDDALFNVTLLAAEGFDGARDEVPLIITGPTGAPRSFAATGLAVDRVMPGVNAVAARHRTGSATALVAALAPA